MRRGGAVSEQDSAHASAEQGQIRGEQFIGHDDAPFGKFRFFHFSARQFKQNAAAQVFKIGDAFQQKAVFCFFQYVNAGAHGFVKRKRRTFAQFDLFLRLLGQEGVL